MRTDKLIVSSNSPQLAEHAMTPAEPKRKRATLMFADIGESTELVTRLVLRPLIKYPNMSQTLCNENPVNHFFSRSET
jgi:class 3 adenylate cyclase